MDPIAIPLAALIVSVTTLVFSALSLRQKAGEGQVSVLEADYKRLVERMALMEKDLANCVQARADLREERLSLLTRIVTLEMTTARQLGER